jgi:hypothetical protein
MRRDDDLYNFDAAKIDAQANQPKSLAGKLDALAGLAPSLSPPISNDQTDADTGEVTEQTNSAASSSATGEPSSAGASEAGQAGSQDPDKASPADNPVSSQKGAPKTSDASGRAASESPSPSKVKDKGAAEAGKNEPPKTEAEYVDFASAWIDALTDADAGEKRWPQEKNLRNKANVGADARETLQTRLAQKCREIRDADQS